MTGQYASPLRSVLPVNCAEALGIKTHLHGFRVSVNISLMIVTFGDRSTSDLFHGISTSRVRRLPTQIIDSTLYKLDILNAAHALKDLQSPPGNRLETLRGDYAGFYSIRINNQWRIIFQWQDGNVHDVQIIDYHK